MRVSHLLTLAGAASAQTPLRPSNISICDYYSNLLLGASNATTQYRLLTLLVNTAVIGNYTPDAKVNVPGILAANATFNGTKVDLVPYFSGALKSTNSGKKHGTSVNFLDGGGAAPLAKNKSADGTSSHQHTLLTHLYSYFGVLLACSNIGQPGFPTYSGENSMYSVHKYMALSSDEVNYFIEQVGLSALSFGVTKLDVAWTAATLQGFFGGKCAAKTSVFPDSKPQFQSICIADDCPDAPNGTCKAYPKVVQPDLNGTDTSSPTTQGHNTNTTAPAAASTNSATSLQLLMGLTALSVVITICCLS